MAKVGAQRAAELTGKSKSTIQRAMNNGKLSYELDSNGRRVIDASELDRAFGLRPSETNQKSVEQELEKASALIEMERMKMRIKMLEAQLETSETQIEDLKAQRDQWQKQASQVLITSQFSQKQAEELQARIDESKRRAEERRKQRLEQKMQSFRPDNENAQDTAQGFTFNGLWKRVKGQR
ncbi:MAG: entry exclusion 1 domain-containing protein [Alphaproteobacteria bacterium]|nr:entry exclusion 1 domain-containing protein [Alphaproteobacteria bacterium]